MRQIRNPARLVPRLRFPDFLNAEAWSAPTLADISTPVEERVGDRTLTPVSISAGVGFVPQTEKFGRDISGNQYRQYTVVSDGDFVYNKGNSLKFPQGCVYDLQGWGEVAAPNVFISFRLKEGFENGFYRQCFEQNIHGIQLRKHITSGARSNGLLNISKDIFFNIRIPTPSREEQLQVANCLESLDELIKAEIRNLKSLSSYKHKLLLELFPREGESYPRARFKDFANAADWEPKAIGKIAVFKSGGTPSKEHGGYWNGSIPWASAKDMKRLFLKDTEDHITPEALLDGAKKVEEGTVLILTRGMTLLRDIPICVTTCPMSFNQDVKALLPIEGLDGKFLAYLLLSRKPQLLSMVDIAGHGTGRLDTEKLKTLEVPLPKDPAEQRNIVGCMISLEDKLLAQVSRIDALNDLKRGLTQRLFPSLEAGRT